MTEKSRCCTSVRYGWSKSSKDVFRNTLQFITPPWWLAFLCAGFFLSHTLALDCYRASNNSKSHGISMPSVSGQPFSLALRATAILKKGLVGPAWLPYPVRGVTLSLGIRCSWGSDPLLSHLQQGRDSPLPKETREGRILGEWQPPVWCCEAARYSGERLWSGGLGIVSWVHHQSVWGAPAECSPLWSLISSFVGCVDWAQSNNL